MLSLSWIHSSSAFSTVIHVTTHIYSLKVEQVGDCLSYSSLRKQVEKVPEKDTQTHYGPGNRQDAISYRK